ncbi:hypothetical protein RRG08_059522, partial [Elysia crispata]
NWVDDEDQTFPEQPAVSPRSPESPEPSEPALVDLWHCLDFQTNPRMIIVTGGDQTRHRHCSCQPEVETKIASRGIHCSLSSRFFSKRSQGGVKDVRSQL